MKLIIDNELSMTDDNIKKLLELFVKDISKNDPRTRAYLQDIKAARGLDKKLKIFLQRLFAHAFSENPSVLKSDLEVELWIDFYPGDWNGSIRHQPAAAYMGGMSSENKIVLELGTKHLISSFFWYYFKGIKPRDLYATILHELTHHQRRKRMKFYERLREWLSRNKENPGEWSARAIVVRAFSRVHEEGMAEFKSILAHKRNQYNFYSKRGYTKKEEPKTYLKLIEESLRYRKTKEEFDKEAGMIPYHLGFSMCLVICIGMHREDYHYALKKGKKAVLNPSQNVLWLKEEDIKTTLAALNRMKYPDFIKEYSRQAKKLGIKPQELGVSPEDYKKLMNEAARIDEIQKKKINRK